jgi:hypothetical protein
MWTDTSLVHSQKANGRIHHPGRLNNTTPTNNNNNHNNNNNNILMNNNMNNNKTNNQHAMPLGSNEPFSLFLLLLLGSFQKNHQHQSTK